MKVDALISLIRAKYNNLHHHEKPIVIVAAVLVSLLLLVILCKGCLAIAANKKNAPSEPMLIRQNGKISIPKSSPLRSQMMIQTINRSATPHIVSFPGIVEADPSHIVNILPPLTGRLIALKIKLGDTVKRDQTLAIIRSPELALAYSNNNKAMSMLKLTSDTLKRVKSIHRAGANAIKDIELAQSNYTQALAEFKRTKATLKTLDNKGANLLTVKAPIPGRITTLNYGIGSYINDLTTPILTISNIKSVWVTAGIPENLAGVVSKNLAVDIFLAAYPKQIWHGKVSFVNDFLEPDTRRNKTRIAVKNLHSKLQPNMFATVKIALPQPDQLIIPISALLMNNDTTSVFVEASPWVFVRHDVEIGTEDSGYVRILSGLKAGDRIVTTGGVLVND